MLQTAVLSTPAQLKVIPRGPLVGPPGPWATPRAAPVTPGPPWPPPHAPGPGDGQLAAAREQGDLNR